MRVFALFVPLTALVACAPSYETAQPVQMAAPETQQPSCNASYFDYMVGEPISVVDTINTPLRVRVLAAESFVPRDFDGNRLTFTTTPEGEVGRVFCG